MSDTRECETFENGLISSFNNENEKQKTFSPNQNIDTHNTLTFEVNFINFSNFTDI